jgi:AcrR family transcriptional regulator
MEPIWARPERAARGPRPAHSRDEVAAAAVRLADAEGLDAVSMRRVAAALGAGTTSLYRYVKSRDELLDLMVDAAVRQVGLPGRTGEWRADLRALAVATRAAMLGRPWLPAVIAARPGLGPGMLRWNEAWFGAAEGTGLDADEVFGLVATVQIFVHGSVMRQLAGQQSGLDLGAWMAAQGAYGDAIIAGGAYPAFIRIMLEAKTPHRADLDDHVFAEGLEHVLDGYQPEAG